MENETGIKLSKIQHELFKNENIIDTVFRPSKNNKLITDGVINVTRSKFMNSIQLMSKFNRKTYIGNCRNCIEKCGIFDNTIRTHPTLKQLSMFQ